MSPRRTSRGRRDPHDRGPRPAATTLLSLHHPGDTWVHRLPAGPKIGLLAAWGVLTVVTPGPWWALALLAAAVALAVGVRLPPRALLAALRPLVLVVVVLGGFQVWQRGWGVAVSVVGDLVALVIAAVVFTATTPSDRVLDAVTRGMRPFRRLGVDPDRVALAFALTLRAVPGLLETARETRDAARARGLERDPRALLVPLALRTVARAYATGDALAARGLGDD